MSRISILVLDAINALELKPSDTRPISKIDIQKIADLIGKELTENQIAKCMKYLNKRKAVGSGFKNKYLIGFFCKLYGENITFESHSTQKTFESSPPKNSSPIQRPLRIPNNQSKNPIKDACNNLTEYLESFGEDNIANPEDPAIKKLIQEILVQFERKPKAREALQKAYELVEETYRNEQAKKGETSASISRERLKKTREQRVQKIQKDIDFMMKNQSSSSAGSAMYFLLNPSWSSKSPQPPSLLKPSHNKRLKELLQNPIQ